MHQSLHQAPDQSLNQVLEQALTCSVVGIPMRNKRRARLLGVGW